MWKRTSNALLGTRQGLTNDFGKNREKVHMDKMDRNAMIGFLQTLNNSGCFNLDTAAAKLPSMAPSTNTNFLPQMMSNNDRDPRNRYHNHSPSCSSFNNGNNGESNSNGNGNSNSNTARQHQQVPPLEIMRRLAQGLPPMPGKMNLPSDGRDGSPSAHLQQQQQQQQRPLDHQEQRVWMERFQSQNAILWERIRHLEQTVNKLEKNGAQLVDFNTKLEVELHEQIEKNKTLAHKNNRIVLDATAKDKQINSLQEQKVLLMKQNSKLHSYLQTTDEFIGSIQSQHELMELEDQHRKLQQQQQKLMQIGAPPPPLCNSNNNSNSNNAASSGRGNANKRKRLYSGDKSGIRRRTNSATDEPKRDAIKLGKGGGNMVAR